MSSSLRREVGTVQIPSWIDTHIPGQRDPYRPRPTPEESLAGLNRMAMDAMTHGLGCARINPNDYFGGIAQMSGSHPMNQAANILRRSGDLT